MPVQRTFKLTLPPSPFLPAQWITPRLTVKDSTLADAPRLTEIFNACSYAEPWDPSFHLVEEDELRGLIRRSLSTAEADLPFRLQAIRVTGQDDPIGYFHLSHCSPRLPQEDTAFISMFVIDPAQQRQGYAQEAAAGLAENLTQCAYVAMWLHVYLKNWPALRFWVQQGFTHIIEYEGDPSHDESTHALLTLERRL
jgi:diamine N-acetyltransferase